MFLQDLEITRGYVPGYHQPLGHEFVGVVEACSSSPQLVGKRVVGEINCNDAHYSCADAVFQRNHAPGRSVYEKAPRTLLLRGGLPEALWFTATAEVVLSVAGPPLHAAT